MPFSLHQPAPWCVMGNVFPELLAPRADRVLPSPLAGESPDAFQSRADSWSDYLKGIVDRTHGFTLDTVTGIAVQPIIGTIYSGATPAEEWCYDLFNMDRITEALSRAANEKSIRALVFHFQSGGGYTRGISAVTKAFEELSIIRPSLPVLAYASTACCSLAYWIACGCDEIHAAPGAEIGGIGTYIVTTDTSAFFEINGIKRRLFSDGVYKGMGADGVEWKDEWYALIDERVQATSKRFKGYVAERRLSVTDRQMQGQSWEAVSLKTGPRDLIDSNVIPSLDQFLSAVSAELDGASALTA